MNHSTLLFTLFCAFACVACNAYGLRPRHPAPDFSALAINPDLKASMVSLKDYAGKYLVLVFYPFDFTYVCPTELISYSDSAHKFKEIGAEVIAVSVDSQFSHLAWLKTPRNQGGVEGLKIPLVSDITKKMSRDFGVLVEETTDELQGASLRGLFIIDGKGIIRSITINDAPVGRSVEETLRTVRAFQYTDEHGEVCPANWQPGAKTIIPDQQKKIEYFGDL